MLGPETAHSPNAEDLTTIYTVMLSVAFALLFIVNAALVLIALGSRSRRGREPESFRGGAGIHWRLGGFLTLVAAAIFAAGVLFTERAEDVEASGPGGLQGSSTLRAQAGAPPPDGESEPLRIRAIGQQWLWRYEYPPPEADAATEQPFATVFSYYELVVPVETTVVLDIESTDVVHRWWVPALSGKFDAVPGRRHQTWFRADEEGTYDGSSYAFSGASYAAMRTRVRVVSPRAYLAWLEQQEADILAAQTAVQEELTAEAEAESADGGGEEGGGE